MSADQNDPIVEQAIEELMAELRNHQLGGLTREAILELLQFRLRALVAKVREPLDQRITASEADLAAARAERDHWEITADAHAKMLMAAQDAAGSREDVDELVKRLVALVAASRSSEEALREVLRTILADPFGCAFCDSGRLRSPDDPAKGHEPDCGYELARAALSSPGTVAPAPEATSAHTETP